MAASSWSRIRPVVVYAGGVVLAGATLWSLGEAISSSVTHSYCRSQAIRYLDANAAFQEWLGLPVVPGAWYNDSIAFSHQGHIAKCDIRFDGTKRSSDVIVRVIRDPGWPSTVLYNILGDRRWKVLSCEAMTIDRGGRAQRMELQPPEGEA